MGSVEREAKRKPTKKIHGSRSEAEGKRGMVLKTKTYPWCDFSVGNPVVDGDFCPLRGLSFEFTVMSLPHARTIPNLDHLRTSRYSRLVSGVPVSEGIYDDRLG